MNPLDRRIITQLLIDAGQPAMTIAEKVGASRQTIAKKIRQFGESGLIEGTFAKVDPVKVGLRERAFIFIQEDPEMKVRRKIETEINALPQVIRFYRLFGRYSGILEVLTRDQDELSVLVKEIHELEGMRETETFIVHSSVKENPQGALIDALSK
jgi:Lrp/AsnC family leucine-responsive transcriptional regulator